MKYNNIFILGAAILSGCASTYSPVLDGKPTARIRLASSFPENTWVSALKEECFDRVESAATMAYLASPVVTPRRESLGIPAEKFSPNTAFQERVIPAGVPINIAFFAEGIYGAVLAGVTAGGTASGGVATDLFCTTAVKFTPVANNDYEMLFELSENKCTLSVVQVRVDSNQSVIRQPVSDTKRLPHCS